jgi:hypothetical protein
MSKEKSFYVPNAPEKIKLRKLEGFKMLRNTPFG